MNNMKKTISMGGLDAKDLIVDFHDRYGEDLESVMIVGLYKGGEVVNAWSRDCQDDISGSLGMLEMIKLDFWNSLLR